MKRVTIISDTTFDLIIKKINSKNFVIDKYFYTESIISNILSNLNQLETTDILLIHFDSIFHRYSDELLQNLLQTIENISTKFSGIILLCNNFNSVHHTSILKKNIGQNLQFSLMNKDLLEKLTNSNNVFMYDLNKIINRIGSENAYNFNTGHLYQMPYTKKLIEGLSSELLSYLNFLITPEKKAIFLDCDNTLWNGIVGEDGIDGIKCDKNAGGILFYNFQEFLIGKKKGRFFIVSML